MWTRSDEQQAVVEELERKGWRVVHEPGDGTVYLSKRGRHRGETLHCEVDEDGSIGGYQED